FGPATRWLTTPKSATANTANSASPPRAPASGSAPAARVTPRRRTESFAIRRKENMAGNSTESLAEKSVINEIVGRAIRDEALSWKVLWFAFCIRRDRRAVRLGDSIPDGRRTQPPVGQNHAHY